MLASGTRFGPYEILSLIGTGGMGEVYRARDTRLDRTVAIKILPQHLSTSILRDRLAREARAVATLNHPHICTLYDIGHEEDSDYLVLEYLEGETLAERIKNGPMRLDQLLRHAIQVSDALDEAHRNGVVHRDLKPGNIMLTKSGAKVLDFGLAKLQKNATVGVEEKTRSLALTREGILLGTVQYMAPEQLEGNEADSRTDIFAFGAVVYEMLTGRKAFEGKNQASLITAIMHTDPQPITTLQPGTPASLNRVIKKCLSKDPRDRWQTARDLKDELQWIAEGNLQPEVLVPIVPHVKRTTRFTWMLFIVAAVLILALLGIYSLPKAKEIMSTRFVITPPEKATFALVNVGGPVSISPDGRQLAFVASGSDGKNHLWLRSFDSLSTQVLPGTDDPAYPFWSPDARFIGFFSGGKLQKIAASGGPPQNLCDSPSGRGGSWNRNDVILFSPNPVSGLYRVSAAGGAAFPATALDRAKNESGHTWPQFLPDGRKFLYYVFAGQREYSGIYVGSLDSKQGRQLLTGNSNVAYAPPRKRGPGYLLFVHGTTLVAQPFDADRLQLSGEPLPVAEQLGYYEGFRIGDFSVSENGVLAYGSGIVYPMAQLIWFGRDGKQLGSVGTAGHYTTPRLSPDRQRLALARMDPKTAAKIIWLLEVATGRSSRFTFDPSSADFPVWSPDGSQIVFATARDGPFNLYRKVVNGGREEPILKSDDFKLPTDWSPDGRFLLFFGMSVKNTNPNSDLWILPLNGDGKPYPLTQTPFNENSGRFSPDGRWIAYASDESGRYEIYVETFARDNSESRRKWQISTNGGIAPTWRHDGKELFYTGLDRKLMAVEVKTSSTTFLPGIPETLFELSGGYDVTADGKRFLVKIKVGEDLSSPITVVLNWFAGLKR